MFKFFLWSDAIWRTANNLLYRLWPLWPYTILAFDRLHISPAFYSIRIRVPYLFWGYIFGDDKIRHIKISRAGHYSTVGSDQLLGRKIGQIDITRWTGWTGSRQENRYHLWVHFDLISATASTVWVIFNIQQQQMPAQLYTSPSHQGGDLPISIPVYNNTR